MRLPDITNRTLLLRCILLILALLPLMPPVALAETVRNDESAVSCELDLPLYEWSDPMIKPKAMVVAIHGMAMHGGSFDALGKSLAAQGFFVVAPDLRGYGRCYRVSNRYPEKANLSYQKSFDDLVRLTEKLRSNHPDLPVFIIGESLGAALALQLAGRRPDLISGLVLSSPAIKRRLIMLPKTFLQAPVLVANPGRQLDLKPYIKYCASDDPRVVQEIMDDPLSRKTMSTRELLASLAAMKATLPYIKEIPPSIPVLIIQGSADRALKANAVVILLSRLKSTDQTVKWFPHRGHVLIETAFLRPPTLEVVEGWLLQHTRTFESAGQKVREAISLDY